MGFPNGRSFGFGMGNQDTQSWAGIDTHAGRAAETKAEEPPLATFFVTILRRLGVENDSCAGHSARLGGVESFAAAAGRRRNRAPVFGFPANSSPRLVSGPAACVGFPRARSIRVETASPGSK